MKKSVIQGSGFLNIQWSKEEKGEIMFFNGKDILLGKGGVPYMLFTSPQIASFEIFNIGKDLFHIKKLVLNSLLGKLMNTEFEYVDLPLWLIEMEELEEIALEKVYLDKIDLIKKVPIKSMTLKDVKFRDIQKVIEIINELPVLEEISYDESFFDAAPLLSSRINKSEI